MLQESIKKIKKNLQTNFLIIKEVLKYIPAKLYVEYLNKNIKRKYRIIHGGILRYFYCDFLQLSIINALFLL